MSGHSRQAGKLLAHIPPKQQLLTHEGDCPGEVEVIRTISSKKYEIFLFCVRCIHAMNVSCLKSGAKEAGKPRQSWQSMRVWQQSKEMVNPALRLLPPAEAAAASYCKALVWYQLVSVWYRLTLLARLCSRKAGMC